VYSVLSKSYVIY